LFPNNGFDVIDQESRADSVYCLQCSFAGEPFMPYPLNGVFSLSYLPLRLLTYDELLSADWNPPLLFSLSAVCSAWQWLRPVAPRS
jgi:hypothetical protein